MDSPLSGRRLWRIAGAIRDRIQAQKALRYDNLRHQVDNLVLELGELEQVCHKLGLCLEHGWLGAAQGLVPQADRLIRAIPYTCTDAERAISGPDPDLPAIREIVAELHQVEEEFDEVHYYAEDDVLAAVTETIELEGVYLGEFEIRLRIEAIGDPQFGSPYRITALDPHCASRNDSVPHPHVSEDRLCAGGATAAIEAALAGGRVCDFFILVRSVLTTYNQHSAYVQLDEWDGSPCHECGGIMDGDETYFCTSCDYEFCSDCSSYCSRCDETTCFACLETCPVCEDRVCAGCMTTCPECGERLCTLCRQEAKCPCLNEEPETEEEPDDNEASRTASAAATGETPAGGSCDEAGVAPETQTTEAGTS